MRARRFISVLALACLTALSCSKDGDFDIGSGGQGGSSSHSSTREPIPAESFDKVFLMVSGGHNDISSYITEDQRDMAGNWLPGGTREDKDVMVCLSRVMKSPGFADVTVPVLYRMCRQADGTVRRDTLHRWGPDDRLFEGNVIHDALEMVRRRFPARSYGMVISSHGTGWLPVRYYYNPTTFENNLQFAVRPRSIGQDDDGEVSVEISLPDFIAAIPYKLDYLLLDCCLCGGVEVAWGLRGKADLVGFSQTEILADGFDYKKIVQRLLGGEKPDARAVCEDYFAQYYKPPEQYPYNGSATISLIDTREMDDLAAVCAALFEKYRTQLAVLDGSEDDWAGWKIQGYFRFNRHYFYDLEDVLIKLGITEEEHAQLSAALERCVLYKAHTPWFMYGSWSGSGFPIKIHSGFSMYLPSMGTAFLNSYYKEYMSWNDATHLVL